MTQPTRTKLAWATNALSVVILICFGLWSLQLREQQHQTMTRAQIVAEAIIQSDTAVIGVDDSGVIVEWNEAATELTKYSQKQAIGQDLLFLVPDQWREAHQAGINRAISDGHLTKPVQQVNCSIRRECGELVPVVFSLRMVDAGDVMFVATMNAADQVLQLNMQDHDPI